jgi:hypothetical protein
MFGFFKRRKKIPAGADANVIAAAACEDVKARWIDYHRTRRLRRRMSLDERIESFSQSMQEFLNDKYPTLSAQPAKFFLLIVCTAILESGTHTTEEIDAAISDLEKRNPGSEGGQPQ